MARTSRCQAGRRSARSAVRGKAKTDDYQERALGVERAGADWGGASSAEAMFGRMLCDAGPCRHPTRRRSARITWTSPGLSSPWKSSAALGLRPRSTENDSATSSMRGGTLSTFEWRPAFPTHRRCYWYVVAHLEFRDRNPSAPRCYRVVRGGGEFVAEGSSEGDACPTYSRNDRPGSSGRSPLRLLSLRLRSPHNITAEASTRDNYIAGEAEKYLGKPAAPDRGTAPGRGTATRVDPMTQRGCCRCPG